MTESTTLKKYHGLLEAHLKHAGDKDKGAMKTQVTLFARAIKRVSEMYIKSGENLIKSGKNLTQSTLYL